MPNTEQKHVRRMSIEVHGHFQHSIGVSFASQSLLILLLDKLGNEVIPYTRLLPQFLESSITIYIFRNSSIWPLGRIKD